MKRIVTGLLMLCLLVTTLMIPVQVGAEVRGELRSDVQVMTGPGERYGLMPGVYLTDGMHLAVRTKCSDGKQTWLQVEFAFDGMKARGYVRSAVVDADLRRVPAEAPLCVGVIADTGAVAAAGPADKGYLLYEEGLRPEASVIVYEVEDGWAHVEYWNASLVRKCRAWIPLSALQADMPFGFEGYYGVAEEESLLIPTPTKAPSTYYGARRKGYPVGVMCTVVSGNCHIKQEAGEDCPTVAYACVGERYEVLECRTGSTGKDWYLVRQGSVYGWISSGLVSLD